MFIFPVRNLLKKVLALLGPVCMLFFAITFPAQALFVSPPKDPMPLIKEIFSTQTKISETTGQGRRSFSMDRL